MNDEGDIPIIDSIAKPSFIKSVYYSSGVLLKPKERTKRFIKENDQCNMLKVKLKQKRLRLNEKTKLSPKTKNSLEELSKLWGIYPRTIHYALQNFVLRKEEGRKIQRATSEIISKETKEKDKEIDSDNKIGDIFNKTRIYKSQKINPIPTMNQNRKKLLFRPMSTHSQSNNKAKGKSKREPRPTVLHKNKKLNNYINNINSEQNVIKGDEDDDNRLFNQMLLEDKDRQIINEEDYKDNINDNNSHSYNKNMNANDNHCNSHRVMSILPKSLQLSSSTGGKVIVNKLKNQEKAIQRNKSHSKYAYPIQSINEQKNCKGKEINEIRNYNDQYSTIVKKRSTLQDNLINNSNSNNSHSITRKTIMNYCLSQKSILNDQCFINDNSKQDISSYKSIAIFDNLTLKSAIDNLEPKQIKSRSLLDIHRRSTTIGSKASITTNTLFNSSLNINHKVKLSDIKSNENSIEIILSDFIKWRKHEEIWSNILELNKKASDLKKYLIPPNYNDILISSYLALYPDQIFKINNSNEQALQSISSASSSLKGLFKQNINKIQFIIDNKTENPKFEVIKWKNAYCNVLSRWSSDRIILTINEARMKSKHKSNSQFKPNLDLKKMIQIIILKANRLFRRIIGLLMNIIQKRFISESMNQNVVLG